MEETATAAAAAAALPDDLLAVVLGRLPARSLAASCRVCKAWRDLIAERHLLLRFRRILPHSVRGLFINYYDYDKCHFLSRPSQSLEHDGAAAGGGPRRTAIDGEFDFIRRAGPDTWDEVVDHCNGLVLFLETYGRNEVLHVCNPATRWSARLPPHPGRHERGLYWRHRRAFLVFDPFVSPEEYKVLLSPPELEEKKKRPMRDARRQMEWPPAVWAAWHEFSSSTGRSVEKAFVREGEAAGTAGDLVLDFCHGKRSCWRYAAYWDGALYIHCRGEYISRFSLIDDKYRVIKSPIQLTEFKDDGKDLQSFLGRSEKGVYFGAIDHKAPTKLQIWTLNESGGLAEWVPKYQSNLKINGEYSWFDVEENNDFDEQKYWILDHGGGRKDQDVSVSLAEQNVCWNSDDDDNIVDVSDDNHNFYEYFKFLGFHPYKEIIFLYCSGKAVAFHLNISKAQYLGTVLLRNTYNGPRESFVYTPCLIGD